MSSVRREIGQDVETLHNRFPRNRANQPLAHTLLWHAT